MAARGCTLTPEDDLFGRIAVFNKFVTLDEIVSCARLIFAEALAGRPRRSLAGTLVAKGFLSAEKARAIQEAVDKQTAAAEGMGQPVAEDIPPEPKPMKRRAPAGDSQVMVAVEGKAESQDAQFQVSVEEAHGFATLKARCHNLYSPERPAFEAACRQLLDTGQGRLFLDIRAVRGIASRIIGELVKLNAEALEAGQRLIVQTDEKTAGTIQMISGGTIKMLVT